MIKVQLLLREGVGEIGPAVDDRRRRGRDPRKVAMAWAFVDAPRETYGGESAYGLRMGGSGALHLSRTPTAVDDEWGDVEVPPDAEVTSAVIEMRVRADWPESMTTFGRLYLRDTGFPVGQGRVGMVGAGIVVNPGGLPEATLLTFEGLDALALTCRRPVPEAVVPGMAAPFPFHQPIWGPEDEPRAFVSTMHPDVVASCARHAELENATGRTTDEEAEFARLSALPEIRSVRGAGMRDAEYQSWREHVRESGRWRDLDPNFDGYPTVTEVEARQAATSEMMAEWLEGRHGPRFR